MIVFEKVTLQNFLSYGNEAVSLDLQRKNPTLITGINHDASVNGEMDSNGCGKSSLLMAITFALYDLALGKESEKKDNLINNINNKDLLVEIDFKIKEDIYKISRYRKNKAMGGSGVKIVKNGKDITPDSISNANVYIAEEIVKVPYEIFSRIITYAASEESFLKMPLAKQRDVIEELFSYTELTKKAETLKEQIKSSKSDLKYAKDSNEEIKQEHARHKKGVEEAEKNIASWNHQHQLDIEEVEKLIEKYSKFNFDKEEILLEKLDVHNKLLKELQSSLTEESRTMTRYTEEQKKFEAYDENKAKKIVELEKELTNYERFSEEDLDKILILFQDRDNLEKEIGEKKRELSKLEKVLDEGLDAVEELEKEKKTLENAKCPYCSQDYKDSKDKLESVVDELKTLSEVLKKTLKTSQEIEESISESTVRLEEIKNQIPNEFTHPFMVGSFRNARDGVKETIEELKVEQNPHSNRNDEIESLLKELGKIKSDIEIEKGKTFDSPSFGTLRELFEAKNKMESAKEKKGYLVEQENPYEKSLETLQGFRVKESKSEEIDSLEKTVKHQEFLLKLLTKKDSFVRKALMDKYLPFLNERLHYYLSTMGLPHKAKFKSDLSMEIGQFDREITFTSLSSGQKARINIALSLAFRDVLQSKHNFINLYILDECLDVGLSNVGVRKTVKLMKEVAEKNKLSMFIISHRDEIKDSFKDQIKIELKNGFSKIVT